MTRPYPSLVCWPCAEAALRKQGVEHPVPEYDVETYRLACGVCGRETRVAETADFFGPIFEGFEMPWESSRV